MALIECPDCGAQVSDAAPACPHCGRPNQPVESLKRDRIRHEAGAAIGGLAVAIGVVAWFFGFGGVGAGIAGGGLAVAGAIAYA